MTVKHSLPALSSRLDYTVCRKCTVHCTVTVLQFKSGSVRLDYFSPKYEYCSEATVWCDSLKLFRDSKCINADINEEMWKCSGQAFPILLFSPTSGLRTAPEHSERAGRAAEQRSHMGENISVFNEIHMRTCSTAGGGSSRTNTRPLQVPMHQVLTKLAISCREN